ncbi:MAG TPA: hypothetical protein DCS55_08235 [Acidimicrobiaceae bacterium]|nr:hypothetical protein [Acidimicrobiaceae bacterium]
MSGRHDNDDPTSSRPDEALLLPRDAKVKGPWFEQRKTRDARPGKWRAKWEVHQPGIDRPVKASEGGFATKKKAMAWAERLQQADHRADGWALDRNGRPIQYVTARNTGPTVAEDVQAFVAQVGRVCWKDDGTFSKNTGVLVRLVAHLVDEPSRTAALLKAWEDQTHRGKSRPEPVSDIEWAGRYLRDAFLPRKAINLSDLDLGLLRGRAWLLEHSLRRDQARVDGAYSALHQHLHFDAAGESRPANTARVYWGTVGRWSRWQVARGAFPSDPTVHFESARRDPDEERVDPDRVPSQPQVWRIALEIATRAGRIVEGMLVLVTAYCALRIGEACDLRRRHVRFEPAAAGGGAWITVRHQWAPPGEDGTPRSDAPKGYESESAGRRTPYLRSRVALLLRFYMRWFVDDDPDAPLFPGKRAARVDPDTFRRDLWKPTIAEMFESSTDPLHDLDIHDLRRAGMTMWLRQRVSNPRVASMGGWKSRKVMLDVYESVLPDDEELSVSQMENRRGSQRISRPAPEMFDADRRELASIMWKFHAVLRREGRAKDTGRP